MPQKTTIALISEVRRRLFEESVVRVFLCLDRLSEAQIWEKPNASSNSVGNLVLHLEGNARQYILSGLGGLPDERQRDLEFEISNLPASELKNRLVSLQTEIEKVLEKVTETLLLQPITVQGFNETGMSILIHVTEHFSYHTGQIALLTKLHLNEDLGFYAGLDLNTTKA